jgi:hypothetical protein
MKQMKTSLRLVVLFLCTLLLAAYGFSTVKGSPKSDSRPAATAPVEKGAVSVAIDDRTIPPPPGVNTRPSSTADRPAIGATPGHGGGALSSNRLRSTKEGTEALRPTPSGPVRQDRSQGGR